QADAAAAQVMAELRSARETLEARLQESAAETRQRMHAAFADTAERMNTLGERVTENEHETARAAELRRAQLAEFEHGALAAIGETVRRDLSAEISEMRERLGDALARLDPVDGAATNAEAESAGQRDALEARLTRGEAAVRDVLAQAQQEW